MMISLRQIKEDGDKHKGHEFLLEVFKKKRNNFTLRCSCLIIVKKDVSLQGCQLWNAKQKKDRKTNK